MNRVGINNVCLHALEDEYDTGSDQYETLYRPGSATRMGGTQGLNHTHNIGTNPMRFILDRPPSD